MAQHNTSPSNSDNILSIIKTHIINTFTFQIQNITPSINESSKLTKHNITNNTVQSYCTWRLSCLIIATPFIFIATILSLIDLNDNFSFLNGLGKLLQLIQRINNIFLFVGIVYAIIEWSNITKSIMVIRIGWFISFILQLIPSFFSSDMIIKDNVLDILGDYGISSYGTNIALSYIITLLPYIITFPNGAIQASLRIRWLLPTSSLASWILIITIPFYLILTITALVVIMQMIGNVCLFLGMILIVLAPLVYLFKRDILFEMWTTTDNTKELLIIKLHRIVIICTVIGYILLLIWSFTAKVNGIRPFGKAKNNDDYIIYLFNYTQAFCIIFNLLGRYIITTILFCDTILYMTLINWKNDKLNQEKFNSNIIIGNDFDAFSNAIITENNHDNTNDSTSKNPETVHDETTNDNNDNFDVDDLPNF